MNGHVPELRPGERLVVCDVCGFVKWSSEVRRRWDGFIVCDDDYEERHPQDLLRAKPEKQRVPFSRSEPADVFIVAAPVDPSSL